jgi:CheY-like chemotaxis protein
MDGYETTRRIRERERLGDAARLPVIALTANALAGDAQRCLDAGMDDYLSKPFEASALERTLDDWILGSLQQPAPASGATAPATSDTTDGAQVRVANSDLPVRRAL